MLINAGPYPFWQRKQGGGREVLNQAIAINSKDASSYHDLGLFINGFRALFRGVVLFM